MSTAYSRPVIILTMEVVELRTFRVSGIWLSQEGRVCLLDQLRFVLLEKPSSSFQHRSRAFFNVIADCNLLQRNARGRMSAFNMALFTARGPVQTRSGYVTVMSREKASAVISRPDTAMYKCCMHVHILII